MALVLLALLAAAARPAAAAIQVALKPGIMNMPPGTEFDLTLDVTQAGSAFNGFAAVVEFDPAALTFMPAASLPSQQGCLMLGGCSASCGNTWHRFSAAGDSLSITDLLLCDQISLTGPGTLYKLHFKASNTVQETWVRFRHATFYDAGLFVTPVLTADAHIGIGVTLDAGDPPPPAPGLSVRAEPNPARGPLSLSIRSDRAGERRLEVFDLAGRLVRRLPGGWRAAGIDRVGWDGADESGTRVRPGLYLVTVRAGGRVAHTRVALIE